MKIFFAVIAAALLAAGPARAATPVTVGHIAAISGAATHMHKGQPEKPLSVKDAVIEGDVIKTGDDGHVVIDFEDDTEITIASHGAFAVDQYFYDATKPDDSRARYQALGTAFSYVGGKMDKAAKPDVQIGLDFGSIGVRGTKLSRAMKNGECWIYLESGKVDVFNDGGKVSLKPGDGTIMSARGKAPLPPHVWTPKEIAWIKGVTAFPQAK